jgi:hypothetical protein
LLYFGLPKDQKTEQDEMQKWEYLQAYNDGNKGPHSGKNNWAHYVSEINGEPIEKWVGPIIFGKTVCKNPDLESFLADIGMK